MQNRDQDTFNKKRKANADAQQGAGQDRPESESSGDEMEMEDRPPIDLSKKKKDLAETTLGTQGARKNQNGDDNQDDDDDDDDDEEMKREEQDDDQQNQHAEGENDEDFEDEEYEELNVKINFYDPNERQYHSVKMLLNSYLDGVSFKSSELADIVVKQVQVGTMVGIDDEDEKNAKDVQVIGFITALSFFQHRGAPVFQEIGNFLLHKSEHHNKQHKVFSDILKPHGGDFSPKVGLLLNERILNMSPYLVPTLHEQFVADLHWLRKEDAAEFEAFNFEHLVVVSKIYEEVNQGAEQGEVRKVRPQQRSLDDYIFQKFEDKAIIQKSLVHFRFEGMSQKNASGVTNISQSHDTMQQQKCIRTVSLLRTQDYLSIIPTLQRELLTADQQA